MSVADELQKLQELRDSGAIDDEEFAAAKAKVLNGTLDPLTSFFKVPPTDEARATQTRQWAALLHLSMLAGYTAVPIAGLVAPIIIWQMKKTELPGLDVHGRNAVNWIISSTIYAVVSAILCLVVIGFPMLIAVLVCDVIFPIVAAVKANNGEVWKYPCTIEFIKG